MVSKKSITPFFSIITCTRNSSKYLSKCLNSVRSQTFTDYEHIIIDGQSDDGTTKLLKEHSLKYKSAVPRGIANAMNLGISAAKGKYLYFLNSDDSFYNDDVLQQVHNYLSEHPNLDWVFGHIHETDGVKTIGYPPKRKIFLGKHEFILKFYNFIPHQATFIKKSVFEKCGNFDEKLKTMMDAEYWLRISKSTSWDYMKIIVANYLIRPDSQSENILNLEKNTKEYEMVQARYLNKVEQAIGNLINKILR